MRAVELGKSRDLLTLLFVAIVAAIPAVGQAQQSPPPEPDSFCYLLPGPTSRCEKFAILEVGVAGPLLDPERYRRVLDGQQHALWDGGDPVFDWTIEWSGGMMANLTTSWALGGMIRVGSGASTPFRGALVRARRWHGANIGLDLQAGLVRHRPPGWGVSSDATGLTASVRFSHADWGYVGMRSDLVRVQEVDTQTGGHTVFEEGGRFMTLMPEVGVSGKGFVAVTGIGAGLFAVLAVACIATDCYE